MPSNSRLVVFLGALVTMLAAGSVYSFSIMSTDLKSSMSLAQRDVQTVASVGNIGMYVGIFAGMFYDRFGSKKTAFVGAAVAAIGYLLAWLRTKHIIALSASPTLDMSLFFAIAWNGGGFLDSAAVTTAVKLFPAHRGLSVGVIKSFFGLSASVLSEIYLAFFDKTKTHKNSDSSNLFFGPSPSNKSSVACPNGHAPLATYDGLPQEYAVQDDASTPGVPFLLLLSIFSLIIGLMSGGMLSDRHNGSIMTAAERSRLVRSYALIFVLATYLAVSAVLDHYFPDSTSLSLGAFSGMLFILASLFGLFLFPTKDSGRRDNDDGVSSGDLAVSLHTDMRTTDLQHLPIAPPRSKPTDQEHHVREFSIADTLTSPDFYLLWIAHFCGTANGLFYLDNVAQIDQSMGGSKVSSALYVSIAGVFNAFGRMAAGYLSDRFARRISRPMFFSLSLIVMSIGQGSMILFPGNNWLYIAGATIGFAYGTFWSLIPPMTIELFGEKHVGLNYQLLGLAPAAGSVLANVFLAAQVYQMHSIPHSNLCCGPMCFKLTHILLSVSSLLGVIAALCVHFRTRAFYGLQEDQHRTQNENTYGSLSGISMED